MVYNIQIVLLCDLRRIVKQNNKIKEVSVIKDSLISILLYNN